MAPIRSTIAPTWDTLVTLFVVLLSTCSKRSALIPKGEGKCERCKKKDPRWTPEHRRLRKQILAGDPACHWCGKRPTTHADHVIPVALGGTTTLDNLVPACEECNKKRGKKPGPPGWGGSVKVADQSPRRPARAKRAAAKPPTGRGRLH